MPSPKEKPLTAKQFLWAEYFIQTRNGTLSARLAKYKGNDNVLAGIAHANLRNPKIKAYLKKRYSEVAMDSNEVLALLAKMARANISEFVNAHGIIDWQKVNEEGYVIKSVHHNKGRASKIVMEERLRALELIGRAHAMFTDKIAPTDPTGQREYGADARSDLISRLLPGLVATATDGEAEETDD